MVWMFKNVGDKNTIWTSDQYETKKEVLEAVLEMYHEESNTCTCYCIEYEIGQFNPESEAIENIERIDASQLYKVF